VLTPTCGRLGKPIWEQISCWLVEQAENTHQSPMKRNTQSLTASRREKRYRVSRITRFTLLGMDINFLPHFKAICRECLKLGTTESSIGEIVFNVRPSCFECNKYYPSRQQLFVSFYWLLCFLTLPDLSRSVPNPYSLEMKLQLHCFLGKNSIFLRRRHRSCGSCFGGHRHNVSDNPGR